MGTSKREDGSAAGTAQPVQGPSKRWLFLRRDPEFLDGLRRLYDPPGKLIEPYVKAGQVVADLGCGTGYVTFPLADLVGPKGKVYAIDLDERCIQRILQKAERGGYQNIEAHAAPASDIGFIPDRSIDFVLANGLLCSMHHNRAGALREIKRILKFAGLAYLSLGMPPPLGLVDEEEWGQTLSGFKLRDGGGWKQRWAVVSLN